MPTPVPPSFPRPLRMPDAPQGFAFHFDRSEELPLDCGRTLAPFDLAYMTYGTLNAARSNAVLLCHALSGDQFAAGIHPMTGKTGWWDRMVGPGKPIDTERYFVICPNVIGGCMGSTGPADNDPETGKSYALDFPLVTIGDMVRAQVRLLDFLGISRLLCVTGGSMGGMQTLEWAARYPDRVASAIPIATAMRHTAQNIALHEIGRQAIMADPDWRGGSYLSEGVLPRGGLSVARMVGHVSYLSEAALARKFGRALQQRESLSFGFDADFQVESYLRHQGNTFVERFDANAYLYISRAMDYFDLESVADGGRAQPFKNTPVRFLVLSFTSDWLFPTSESREIAGHLRAGGADVQFHEIESDCGHDAFLLDEPELEDKMRAFLDSVARQCDVG